MYLKDVEFGSKFSYAPIWGRECCGVKNAKFTPFQANQYKIKSCVKFQKINPPSQLGGEIWEFPSFWLWKSTVPPLSPLRIELRSWNLVCTFSEVLDVPFGMPTFSPISTPHSPKEVVFWSGSLIFWVFSSHNSPPNWAKTLQLGVYI